MRVLTVCRFISPWLLALLCCGLTSGHLHAQPEQRKRFLVAFYADPLHPVCLADRMPGANAGEKIAVCIAALPATGGTVDARGLQGAQTILQNLFSGVTKPVRLLLGDATFTMLVTQTITNNGVHILGNSPFSTKISFTLANANAFTADIPFAPGSTTGHSFRLADLAVTGTGAGTGSGVAILSAFKFRLGDLLIKSFGRDGVQIDSSAGGNADLGIVENCISHSNGRRGYYVLGVDSNAINWVSDSAYANGENGFHFSSPWQVLDATDSSSNAGAGYYIESHDIVGNVYSEANTGAEVEFPAGVSVVRNTIRHLGAIGLADLTDADTSRGNGVFLNDVAGTGWYRLPVTSINSNQGLTLTNSKDATFNVDLSGGIPAGVQRITMLRYLDKDGAVRWKLEKQADHTWRLVDEANTQTRLRFTPLGATYLDADAAGAVNLGMAADGGTGGVIFGSGGAAPAAVASISATGALGQTGVAFAALGTPANGTMIFCTNCTIANPCAAAGTGAIAKRLNGIWVCN